MTDQEFVEMFWSVVKLVRCVRILQVMMESVGILWKVVECFGMGLIVMEWVEMLRNVSDMVKRFILEYLET